MKRYFSGDEAEEAEARIAALEAELAEAQAALVRERTEWADLLRTVVTDARSAALEEAARYIEGLGMPGAVGIRALMKKPRPGAIDIGGPPIVPPARRL